MVTFDIMKKRKAKRKEYKYTLMSHARSIHEVLEPGGQMTVNTLNAVTLKNLQGYMSLINKEKNQNKKFKIVYDQNNNILVTRIL